MSKAKTAGQTDDQLLSRAEALRARMADPQASKATKRAAKRALGRLRVAITERAEAGHG